MKLSVQPERKTDNKYENEADDDFCPSSQQPFQPAHHGLEENPFDDDENTFISDYQSDPKSSRRHTSLEEKRIDLEMLKEKNRNLKLRHTMKRTRTLSGPEESSIPMRSWSIKQSKKEEIYHSKDYANFRSFYHQIESGSKGWTPNEKYKEAKRLLAIKEVHSWNHYRMEKNACEDWIALKDFLNQLLGDRVHQVNTSWLDWVQAKKAFNESDDTFLQRFNTLKTQIGDQTNDPVKIEVMLFFAGLDEPMQQKIREQSNMPETKHNLVALTKKLRPNLDREPKPSLPTRTCPTHSTSAQPEWSDTFVASSSHEDSPRKEVFCSYCERNGHKETQYRKKFRDAKHREEAWPNTAGAQITTVNESGSDDLRAEDKNPARRQWLVVVLVGQEIQAFVDTTSDLNLIRKDIADPLCLRLFFSAKAAKQASGIPLKTYSVLHERVQITDSLSEYLDARDPLTSANIEVPLILGLLWLIHHNPILNFDLKTIHW